MKRAFAWIGLVVMTALTPETDGAGPEGTASSRPAADVDVGRRRQLLVDDRVIERREGVIRTLGQVKKLNGGKPIFTAGRFYGTVLHDAGRFKMWYRHIENRGYGYAESTDGLHFKPLGDLQGINFAGDYTLSVIIDSHEQRPDHRFKASYDGPGMAAAIAHSADGIHWSCYNGGQAVTGRAADTYNQIIWDDAAHLYRLFTRTDFGSGGGPREIRGTRGMTNPDIHRNPTDWKTVRSWKFDREGEQEWQRRQLYGLTDWIHEGVHFGLLTVYEWPGDFSEGPQHHRRRHERDVMNFYIATSRDADTWDLSWVYAGKPMIPRGGEGAFDKDMVIPASAIVTVGDEHWLYYCGANERHGNEQQKFEREMPIGVAVLPRDRFVGLHAGAEPGVILTKPFVFDGSSIELNVAAAEGEVGVEVLDADGMELADWCGENAARAVRTDQVHWRVPWRKSQSISSLAHKRVRLRLTLRNATAYAFQVLKVAD